MAMESNTATSVAQANALKGYPACTDIMALPNDSKALTSSMPPSTQDMDVAMEDDLAITAQADKGSAVTGKGTLVKRRRKRGRHAAHSSPAVKVSNVPQLPLPDHMEVEEFLRAGGLVGDDKGGAGNKVDQTPCPASRSRRNNSDGPRWTPEQDRQLVEMYKVTPKAQLASFFGRSLKACRMRYARVRKHLEQAEEKEEEESIVLLAEKMSL